MKIVYEWDAYHLKPEVLAETPTPYVALRHLRRQQALIKELEVQAEMERFRLGWYERQLIEAQDLEDATKATIAEALKAIKERDRD